ncbi:hypothetical protein F4808DRAFT_457545 [Astrocystis sublimbata]|nr:hypothetical protein F4808DRAFT_457545 [Astrocystis sublimbata]
MIEESFERIDELVFDKSSEGGSEEGPELLMTGPGLVQEPVPSPSSTTWLHVSTPTVSPPTEASSNSRKNSGKKRSKRARSTPTVSPLTEASSNGRKNSGKKRSKRAGSTPTVSPLTEASSNSRKNSGKERRNRAEPTAVSPRAVDAKNNVNTPNRYSVPPSFNHFQLGSRLRKTPVPAPQPWVGLGIPNPFTDSPPHPRISRSKPSTPLAIIEHLKNEETDLSAVFGSLSDRENGWMDVMSSPLAKKAHRRNHKGMTKPKKQCF